MDNRQLGIESPKINNIFKNTNFLRINIKKCCSIDTQRYSIGGYIGYLTIEPCSELPVRHFRAYQKKSLKKVFKNNAVT